MNHNSNWKNKKVLITGHTGFKGSWLSLYLKRQGAIVYGLSNNIPTHPSIYEIANIQDEIADDFRIDIRDFSNLKDIISKIKPEVVFHLAAQALVLESYNDPINTYSTNVMGTVNLLEAIRLIDSINAVIVVSSDKCYENKEWVWGYREDERMGGFDPYSNSKGCAELITSAYVSSFFNKSETAVASARAGNVIGGGDWAKNRLVPDFFRALEKKETLVLRYPNAIRPWQHVLEPISGYVKLAESLIKDNKNFIGGWNFGPSDEDAKTVIWVIEFLSGFYSDFKWKVENQESVHETNYLKLDISKARMNLGWKPKWKTEIALTKTIEWYNALIEKRDMLKTTYQQIEEYTISKIG